MWDCTKLPRFMNNGVWLNLEIQPKPKSNVACEHENELNNFVKTLTPQLCVFIAKCIKVNRNNEIKFTVLFN